jgi:hypothetical protein
MASSSLLLTLKIKNFLLITCVCLFCTGRGFYKGWLANALKVVPQNSIRFVSYEFMKTLLGVKKQKTDT